LEERPGLLIIPRGIRQPLLEQLTRSRVPLADIVEVERGRRVLVGSLMVVSMRDVSSGLGRTHRLLYYLKGGPCQLMATDVAIGQEDDPARTVVLPILIGE
jgi:hypothetical protein